VTAALAGQAQNPPPAGATPVPVPQGAPTPRPTPPELTALTAAIRLTDPEAKLAALEKIRADFPESSNLAVVDTQLLSALLAFPDRLPAITTVFDRIVGRIPADATPDARLTQTIAPVNQVIAKKVLLDRSDELMTAAMAALTPEAHAAALRATAARLKQPEPTAERLQTSYAASRARGLEAQARIANAKGDTAAAERLYKESVDASAAFGPAVTSLVDIYSARKEFDKAEAVLLASIKAAVPVTSIATATVITSSPALASRPTMALADLYERTGNEAKLEALLRETLEKSPTTPGVSVKLAKLEARRGNDAAALDLFVGAAAQGSLAAADDGAMRALYRKARGGSEAGLDDLVDTKYREKFPNPVKAEPYTPLPDRTDRLVLLEMFTGSACAPCVSADLAFDAVMEHYPAGTIVPVAYHQHIPGPDPMVTAAGSARREYYTPFAGVPTFNIDGALGRLGGGARTGAPAVYKDYISKIDKALQTPATAALSVAAAGDGDRITVTANVTKLPADAKDLRLHILLVERHLRFTGENGIRFHPMVVRASAGDKGAGLPITATGRTEQTFSLSAIREDVTKSLQADIERRRKTEAPGSTPREYAADGRPYVAIDTDHLAVVAFIQQGAYRPPAPAGAAVAGIESTADAGAQATRTTTAPATPPRPAAAAGPLTNVLQAAIGDVVFPAGAKGKGK
jgi:tetratricopeptide (TPR) repeat protein